MLRWSGKGCRPGSVLLCNNHYPTVIAGSKSGGPTLSTFIQHRLQTEHKKSLVHCLEYLERAVSMGLRQQWDVCSRTSSDHQARCGAMYFSGFFFHFSVPHVHKQSFFLRNEMAEHPSITFKKKEDQTLFHNFHTVLQTASKPTTKNFITLP
jgi:hypothetical protein